MSPSSSTTLVELIDLAWQNFRTAVRFVWNFAPHAL